MQVPPPPPKRVLIVDDHAVLRHGLRQILESRFTVVGEAHEGGEALQKALELRPDVVVMDVQMAGMNGLAATKQIKEQCPNTNIVVLTARDDNDTIFEAISAGASAFVVKDDSPQTIVAAVEQAAEGNAYLPPVIAKRVMGGTAGLMNGRGPTTKAIPLSGREIEVLRLVALGKRNREIGDVLCISERTVGNHISSIYNKLGINDRAQAVVYAIKEGLVHV
jgi:two-component system NarL family response regulator